MTEHPPTRFCFLLGGLGEGRRAEAVPLELPVNPLHLKRKTKAVQLGEFRLPFLLLGRKGCRFKPPNGMAWANSAGGGVERAAGGERLRKWRITLSISQGEQERRSPPVTSELTTIQWRHFLQKRRLVSNRGKYSSWALLTVWGSGGSPALPSILHPQGAPRTCRGVGRRTP